MGTVAKVRSVDALESFRASLVVFLTKARRAVDQVGEEVARTRQWVQVDRRMFWTEQLRKRTRAFEQAEQELYSAKLSTLKDTVTMQEMQVRKAKRAVDEATEKLAKVKIWNRDFDRYLDPLAKKMETLRQFLDDTLPKAIHYLMEAQKTLEAYAETPLYEQEAGPAAAPMPAPATPPENASSS